MGFAFIGALYRSRELPRQVARCLLKEPELPRELVADERTHDAEVFDHQRSPVDEALELLTGPYPAQALRVTAQQQEADEVPTMRFQSDGFERLDLSLLLQFAVVGEGLVEHLQRLLFAAVDRRTPTDEEGIRHDLTPLPIAPPHAGDDIAASWSRTAAGRVPSRAWGTTLRPPQSRSCPPSQSCSTALTRSCSSTGSAMAA